MSVSAAGGVAHTHAAPAGKPEKPNAEPSNDIISYVWQAPIGRKTLLMVV